jgi:hypothetical protein
VVLGVNTAMVPWAQGIGFAIVLRADETQSLVAYPRAA